jgi:DNA-binding transcriptional ArsR family regulator
MSRRSIPRPSRVLKQMLYQRPALDLMFHALADPTRRLIVDRLTRGPATVSDLARPFDMTLPAVVQHLRVLEAGGLVTSEKVGRVRTCRVEPDALRTAERWIGERRTTWEARLDRLGPSRPSGSAAVPRSGRAASTHWPSASAASTRWRTASMAPASCSTSWAPSWQGRP